MDRPADLGDFLRSRRARLRPEDVGLVSYGARRVPGLRREELAQLAGVSPTYYGRLEQGQSRNASDEVLDAVSAALRLTPDEHAHLLAIARPGRRRRRAPAPATAVGPGLRQLVQALDPVPVVVLDPRSDVLAWNRTAHALLAGHRAVTDPDAAATRPNLTRMLFLDAHTRELHADWAGEARRAVASLRVLAGRHRDDRRLSELVGDLTLRSEAFATLWAGHAVAACSSGTKRLHHPTVGELELGFEVVQTVDDPDLRMILYSAAPGSPSAAALALLSAGRA